METRRTPEALGTSWSWPTCIASESNRSVSVFLSFPFFFFCYCSFCFLFFFQHVFRHSMEFNFNRWRYTATGHAARDPPSSVTRDLICALPVELLNELAVCGAWAGSAVPDELLAGAQQRRSLHRLRPPAAAPLGSPAASDNAPRALLVPTRVARRRIAIQ